MNWKKYLTIGLIAAAAASFSACDDDETNPSTDTGVDTDEDTDGGEGPQIEQLPTTIDSDTTLTADTVWVLTDLTYVEDAILTIEPGTLVVGENGSALVVTTTGRIEAIGEANNPIVFAPSTINDEPQPGDWGGVVLLGNAEINVDGGVDAIEGIDPTDDRGNYGGDDDSHDCGTLRYVRIEYAGFRFGQDNELNSLTTGACGSETDLSYIQVTDGLDDGIEFFGGTHGLRYAVITNAGDDGLDLDQGFRGDIQYVYIESYTQDSDDPRAFEWDGLSANFTAEPRTAPVVANITAILRTDEPGMSGFVPRRGVQAEIYNAVLMNYTGDYLDLRDAESSLVIDGIALFGEGTDVADYLRDESGEGDNDGGFDEAGAITGASSNLVGVDPQIPAGSGVPAAASPLAGAGVELPAGFDDVDYIGAFEPGGDDWTAGWTRFPTR